jgi:protease I
MTSKPLEGKKVAVIVENKFIPEEIEAYRSGFAVLGAQVEFISRIWYGEDRPSNPVKFYSDIDPNDNEPWQSPQILSVHNNNDVSALRLEDYAAVIMAANYTSVRLRYFSENTERDPKELVKTPPVVEFFARAMENRKVVKGALCHGLWVLTPNPKLLEGRKVTCHTVVMADIINCGAEIVFKDGKVALVHTDEDLVTGFSKHEVVQFIEAIAEQIQKLSDAGA